MKPAMRKIKLIEPVENDDVFQPVAAQGDDYYLHNDEKLVEEDPLSPPRNRFSEALTKQSVLPRASSLRIHPVPTRSIGGIQDQVHATQASCICKGKTTTTGNKASSSNNNRRRRKTGSACLMLYCDCFALGSYCNAACHCAASCYNTASEPNVKPRTQAIVEALRHDPHAFRHIHYTTAEQQKSHRARLTNKASMEMSRNKRDKRGDEQDDPAVKPPAVVLTLQLPPSYYTAPLKVHDESTILTGLSFSLTHPRHRKRKSKSSSSGVGGASVASKKKKHLYHDLMLSPSKNLHLEDKGASDAAGAAEVLLPEHKLCKIGPTDCEVFWEDQTNLLNRVFELARNEVAPSTRAQAAAAAASSGTTENRPHPPTSEKMVQTLVPTLKEDIDGLKAVATAAKGDLMARFFTENRLKVVGAGATGVACRYGAPGEEVAERLECPEELPPLVQPTGSKTVSEEARLRELTIFAAQDTAILQETARIIRKTARELCERRIHRKKEKKRESRTSVD